MAVDIEQSVQDASSTGDKEAETTHRTAILLACSGIFIGLVVIAAFLVLNSSEQRGGTTGEVSEAYVPGGPSGPSGSSGPAGPAGPANTPPSIPSESMPPKGVSKAPTPTTTTTTTTTPLILTTAFACTVSSEMPLDFVFPPDGMCEVIFFTGLYAYGRHMLNASLTPEVERFAKHSKANTNRTRYGIGFSVLNLTEAVTTVEIRRNKQDKLPPNIAMRLDYFADHNCNNYAIYDMETISIFEGALGSYGDSYYEQVRRLFNSIVGYHKNKGQTVGFLAVGAIFDQMNLDYYSSDFYKPLFDFPLKGHLKYWFVLTHFPFVEYLEAKKCYVETPMVFDHPPPPEKTLPYAGVRMVDAWYNFYYFDHISKHPFDQIQLSITVSLRPNIKVPMNEDGYSWFSECKLRINRDFVHGYYPPGFIRTTNLSEIYTDPEYSKNIDCYQDHQDKGCKTFSKTKERIITWDDEYSLRTKVCVTKTNITGYLFGLTAYEIDLDDWNYQFPQHSPYGPYSRLRMLYQLHKYISTGFLGPEHEPVCRTVEPKKISLEDFRKIESWPIEGV